ncbi:MAG: M20 family metallopeptidase [Thermotogae bacterium]|nr:M20 family metallopeptidase [Thermotogota bacterium]
MSKDKIIEIVDEIKVELINIAKKIFEYSETAFQERKSSKLLSDFLEKEGFKVERRIANLETAFLAEFGDGKPKIALLAEYDALPEIGHACGHNMIGVMSVGAAVALRRLGDIKGTIMVVGSPAEEKGAGKKILVEAGVFKDVDVAMMIHPASMNTGYDIAYALRAFKIEYFGKASHAASSPDKGINALDSMISLFSMIGLMRQQLPEKVRIHGIITNGGQASNIIPEYTSAEITVRALDEKNLNETVEKFKNIVESAAKAHGCEYKITELDSMEAVLVNEPLAKTLEKNYKSLGMKITKRTYEQGVGSTDMGIVTQTVPGIHAYVDITGGIDIPVHTRDFAQAANSEDGYKAMINATKALASTCWDVMNSEELLQEIVSYFERRKGIASS